MQQSAKGGAFSTAEVRQQRDRLRDRIRDMEQAHDRLMQGLNQEQKDALRDRIQNMQRDRDRIRKQLQEIDAEVANGSPNRDRIRKQTRELEKAAERWQKQHRELGKELGMGKEA
jgi:uncharacterized coiled-coil DUF342 family protein